MSKLINDILIIGNVDYEIKRTELKQKDLKFFPENPRVFSVLNMTDEEPTQEQIEEIMCKTEHVKKLKESIKSNGGLIDPIFVRDGDMVVLEGNSRLAAYRILHKQNPIRWSKLKAILLPKDIPDSAVFSLLGQFHIIGRKDWEPYEQAGYLYRTLCDTNKTIEILAAELGITKSSIKKLIDVYEYMLENGDNHPSKWSYYEELLKNRGIKKAFEEVPGLEDKIIDDIKNNKIRMAIDIRKLGDISKVNDNLSRRILNDIANGERDIYSGYEVVEDTGKMDNNYQYIKNFKEKILNSSSTGKLLKDKNINDIEFELKKIQKIIENILLNIEKDKKQ
ncbi:MAG: ParB N-terminal domain-containing protein [Bacilli bacterium]|nr:ParB N-terminal domain-containing protein [Bacilli bacterium]